MNLLPYIENNNITVKKYLKFIYGISSSKIINICKTLGINEVYQFNNLTTKDLKKLTDILFIKNRYLLEADLRKKQYDNIKLIKQLRNYKGIRHSLNLSVNGQNTKTNAKTQKWKRKKK